MDEARDPAQNAPADSAPAAVFVIVAVPQLLMSLFTCTGCDGGFAWSVYSCVLLVYWGLIGLIWRLGFANGRSLGWIVVASGWLPPVWCGLWILGAFGHYRGLFGL